MANKDKPSKSEEKKTDKRTDDLLHKQWHHIPVVLIGLVGVAIIVASVAGLILSFSSSKNENKETATLQTAYDDSGLTYEERADQMAFYGNYDEAQWTLDAGIENSEDNEVAQGEFYLKKTYIALNAGEYDDAFEAALKAEEILQTIESAALVAEAAEVAGDNLTALDHWILAAERTPEEERSPDSFGTDYGYFLFRIEELGGNYEQ